MYVVVSNPAYLNHRFLSFWLITSNTLLFNQFQFSALQQIFEGLKISNLIRVLRVFRRRKSRESGAPKSSEDPGSTAEAQDEPEATHSLHDSTTSVARAEVQGKTVPVDRRARRVLLSTQPHRNSSENLVPKQTRQTEATARSRDRKTAHVSASHVPSRTRTQPLRLHCKPHGLIRTSNVE